MAKRHRQKPGIVKFQAGTNLGSEVAEYDPLLDACFIESTAFRAVRSFDDPRCVLVGRQGTGKTAILRYVEESHDDVIRIDPQSLSFPLLYGSELLQTLRSIGVSLDMFYQALWRHIIVMHIVNHYLPGHIGNTGRLRETFMNIFRFRDGKARRVQEAVEFLETLPPNFFEVTSEGITELHRRLESNFKSSFGTSGPWSQVLGVKSQIQSGITASQEHKERVSKAATIVNTTDIHKLNEVRDMIDSHIVTDNMKRGYIIIDDLDTAWIDDSIVNDLIRALMNEVFSFRQKVKNVKVLVAIRENIPHKIEHTDTPARYQREKLEAQRIRMTWTPPELKGLVNARLNYIFENVRLTRKITYDDVMPAKVGDNPSGMDYMIQRSSGRPRDIIRYFNLCARESAAKSRISMATIKSAEQEFSRWKINGAGDEWRENYPGISELAVSTLADQPPIFRIGDWDETKVFDGVASLSGIAWISELAEDMLGDSMRRSNVRRKLSEVFYEVGVIGLRIGAGGATQYAFEHAPEISYLELSDDTRIEIHPGFRRHLRSLPYPLAS